jgi:hypothetical protein
MSELDLLIKHLNGSKQWYKNGKRHREDGPAYIGADGTKAWYKNGKLHRVDGPAIEFPNGTKQWCLNDNLHREDGPAIEYANGAKDWYLNGKLHREDGPAVEQADGLKEWWLNGQCHREDGPAVERADGCKEWWLNGKRHREDGPACEHPDGSKEWYLNGGRHREDGPAVEWSDGYTAWWLNGIPYTEFNWKIAVAELNKEREEANKPKLQETKVEYLGQVPKNYTGIIEWADGSREWYLNGERHREDGPAIEYLNGSKQWYLNSKRHRIDGPAIEYYDGTKEWWLNGRRHREDGPAVEFADGSKAWWLNGTAYTEFDWKIAVEKLKQKREEANKPKLPVLEIQYAGEQIPNDYTGIVKYPNGYKEWYLNGKLHREDGPAIELADGTKEWWLNGKLHRVDGPAVEWADGDKHWWLNGEYYSEAEWKIAVEKLKSERGSLTVEVPVTTVSEAASAPPATVQGAAKEESKSKDQKTMSKMDNLKKVAKSDMTETGKRVAADQMSKAATAALVKILSDGKSEKEAKSIRKQLTEALETPGGRMVVSMMMGCIGPALKDKFPAEYQTIVDDISKELRVQAETHAARAGVDMMTPVIKAGLEGVQSAFDGVLAVEEKEKTVAATSIRAELPKASLGKIPTETHEVEAVKDTLKKNKK